MTQVLLQKCDNYDYSIVYQKVSTILEHFSPKLPLPPKNGKVLLKPNMLSCKTPDHAATTHPTLVQAVAEWFVKNGLKVFIGDSPPAVFGRTEKFWETTGFADAAKKSGAELVCFETQPKKAIEFSCNGKIRQVHITSAYFEADLVVNLPKLKTHNLTRITGAVKNLFGLVPGLQKAVWHKVFTKSFEFGNFVTDLAYNLPTHLTIMDAIEGMEGQGPAGGTRVFPGLLMASTCPVAIDRTFCNICGIDENKVTSLKRANELNWGPASFAGIETLGDSIAQFRLSSFKVPGMTPQDYLPDRLLDALKTLVWAGPQLKEGLCIRCGRCAEICPVNAISITETGAIFDRNLCISCFCCMEVCPVDAIIADKSPLLQLAFKIRQLKRVFKSKK
jgi:uncharacterized protein (DUF362 family)/Pyruvate/2-oxoacid:ferredoxin oxidoreductase delta subunit